MSYIELIIDCGQVLAIAYIVSYIELIIDCGQVLAIAYIVSYLNVVLEVRALRLFTVFQR